MHREGVLIGRVVSGQHSPYTCTLILGEISHTFIILSFALDQGGRIEGNFLIVDPNAEDKGDKFWAIKSRTSGAILYADECPGIW